MTDKTNPEHYKNKPIQTIQAIRSQLSDEEYIGYLKGSILKYISRAGIKYKGYEGMREDVSKAHRMTEFLLEVLADHIGDSK